MNQNETFYNFILLRTSLITSLLFIVALVFGIYNWPNFNKSIKIIFWYLFSRLILTGLVALFSWSIIIHANSFWNPILGGSIMLDLENSHNNFSNGIYYLIYILFPGLFFLEILKEFKKIIWLKFVLIFLILFLLVNYFFIDGFRSYGIVGATVSDLFLITMPCIYFWKISNKPLDFPLLKNSYFWICLAIFLPHVVHLPVSITATNLYESNYILYCITHIARNFIHFISLILYIIGFYYAKYLKYF